jgi:flavodoxin
MKVLITYYSGRGNTKKIAYAIKEGLSGHEVDLLPVKDANPAELGSYDILFLGSGTYGFNISRKITSLIKKASSLPTNIAYFSTHESQKSWPNAFKSVNDMLKDHDCKILGEFDCCGENLVEKAQEQREAMYSRMKPEEKAEVERIYHNFVKGRPNEKDLNDAKDFANEVMQKLS